MAAMIPPAMDGVYGQSTYLGTDESDMAGRGLNLFGIVNATSNLSCVQARHDKTKMPICCGKPVWSILLKSENKTLKIAVRCRTSSR
jgi:hypothetical protein